MPRPLRKLGGMNLRRARWARMSVQAFARSTSTRPEKASIKVILKDLGGLDSAIADLLCDLRHLCDQNGFNYAKLDERGYDHYVVEKVQDNW